MKQAYLLLLVLVFAGLAGCETYHLNYGHIYRNAFPVHDKTFAKDLDTTRFVRRPFSVKEYSRGSGVANGKHIVQPITGADIASLATLPGKHYIYFWFATCPGTLRGIQLLDSLAAKGASVMVVALVKRYETIDKRLSGTSFAQYPYYVIEDEKYARTILRRQIQIIREACEPCYEQYLDEIMLADCLMVDNGRIKVLMPGDKESPLAARYANGNKQPKQ